MAHADAAERLAGAPISWGVCEVPGWGHRMPAARVFAEMAALGLRAAEAGPEGFLPADPVQARDFLQQWGLRLVGGFVPAVLHRPDRAARARLKRAAAWLAAAGAGVLVLAADSAGDGYDGVTELGEQQWRHLLAGLDAAVDVAGERGLLAALHPHVGTVVERRPALERVLEGSAIPLCLDTGHLLIGGIDPVGLAGAVADRIRHVQFKDVSAELAEQVRAGRMTYTAAVRAGLYQPLGDGDVDVAGVVRRLEGAGFSGWYVLEQDVVLDREPPEGEGPVRDARRSVAYLRSLLDTGKSATTEGGP